MKQCEHPKCTTEIDMENAHPNKKYCSKKCQKNADYYRNKQTYIEYEKRNRKRINERVQKYYHQNKEIINERNKARYHRHPKEHIERVKQYRLNNTEKVKKAKQIYGEKYKPIRNKRHRQRYKEDDVYRLRFNIRTRLRGFLRDKGWDKDCETSKLIGCTYEELKIYLEEQFDKNMSWENYGTYWHIDHIIPLNSAENVQDIKKLSYYKNLQPLEALENLKKSDTY